jgi:DNA excision repair protein ERCC-6
MKDLFQLADEKESGTETGDLFAGTGANEIRAAEDIVDVNARKATGDVENDKGDNSATTQMLKDLFNSSDNGNPLQSAMNHDAMMKAGSSGVDADLMQHETERLVTQAVEEVNRSARERRRDGVGVPTWTGRSGLAGIPRSTGKAIVGAAGIGQATGGGLLLQIKQRENGAILRAQSNDASASQLLQDIVSFLLTRNGVSTSDDMVSRFESKVGAGGQSLAMFKATLKRVAVLKKDSGPSGESVWHLRSAYKD